MKHLTIYAKLALGTLAPLSAIAEVDTEELLTDTFQLEDFSVDSKETAHANLVLRPEQVEIASSLTSALDHINTLPGVIVQEGDAFGGDDWSTSVSIRGFQTTRNSSQLGYTIDGLPNGNTNYGGGAKPNRFIDSENIGEVIVSQGAGDIASASTTALGGTIQYNMVTPTFDRSTNVSYTTGDFNAQRYFVRVNSGLIGESTRGFVSLSDSHHNRWTETGNSGRSDRQHMDSRIITSLGNAQLDFRLSYDDIHEDNYNGVSIDQFEQNPDWDYLTGTWTGSPIVDQNFVEGWSTVRENVLTGVKLTLPIGDSTVIEAQPYFHNQTGEGHWIPPYQRRGLDASSNQVSEAQLADTEYRVFFVDASGNDILPDESITNPFDIDQYPVDNATKASAVPASSFRTSHYGNSRFGTRINLEHTVADHRIVGGLWYEQQERENARDWHKIFNPLVNMEYNHIPYWTDFDQTLDTDTTMLYIQDTFTMENFVAQVGLKQYYVEISGNDNITNTALESRNSDSDILPSIGAIYKVFDNQGQLFFNYTQNFAAMNDTVIQLDASPSLEPEQSDSIDLGYRHNAGNLSWTASIYSIEFDNRISFVDPEGDDVTEINYDIGIEGGYVNVGGIESQGLEVAANYRFNDAFSANASFSLNNSEYVEDIPENGVVKGNEVVGAASEIFVLGFFYKNENGFYSNFTAKYTGDRQGTLDNSEQMDAYIHANLAIGFQREIDSDFAKAFTAEIKVHNLFDKSYLATPDGDAAQTSGRYFIGAPRTVSMTFGLEF
ncbi:TonB-dependent receptor [Puniceicoccaceae bacterium K14]|nr:TonB-dependent receptor [Puniceicoccaceae bacterium K14]